MFAFTYNELKAYREDVFQHTKPLKQEMKEVNPFQQKLRQKNPKLACILKKELENMLAFGIIVNKASFLVLQLGCGPIKEWSNKYMYRFLKS